MVILAIHWNINSSVALMISGEIVSAVSEERFSRKKNDSSFPIKSIEWILAENKIEMGDIDVVVLPNIEFGKKYQLIRRYDSFEIEDYVKEQEQYWYPLLYERKEVNYLNVFKDKIDIKQYPTDYWEKQVDSNDEIIIEQLDYRTEILKKVGFPEKKIKYKEHHSCHLAYAYFSSPFVYMDKKVLGFTLDGIGDGLNATVNIIDGKGNF